MARSYKFALLAVFAIVIAAGGADAASVINKDATSQTIVVDDGHGRSEISIPAGGSVDVCQSGCLVTFPDGENRALTGAEIIEITATSVSLQ
ncbi:MAG: hypothetical protein ACTHJV_10950 [Rhizobiaceae bacterium]